MNEHKSKINERKYNKLMVERNGRQTDTETIKVYV